VAVVAAAVPMRLATVRNWRSWWYQPLFASLGITAEQLPWKWSQVLMRRVEDAVRHKSAQASSA